MKNLTISLDESLYHEARVLAARRRTSLSAMVRDYLTALVQGREPVGFLSEGPSREQTEGEALAKLFQEANLVLGFQPGRDKTYER